MTATGRTRPLRIPVIANPDEEQAAMLAKTRVPTSPEPPNLFKTLVHHPLLMQRVNALGGLFMVKGLLDARTRELTILRVACRTACGYEYAQHVLLGARAGVTQEEIDLLTREAALTEWPEADQSLLTAVDELLDHRDLADATYQRLLANRAWSDAQVLEFTTVVGFYAMLAGVINAAGIELDLLGDAS